MSDEKYPSQLAERFQVRMPDGLRDQLRLAAERSGRSMNSEIIARLSQSLALPPIDLPPDLERRMLEAPEEIRTKRGAWLLGELTDMFPPPPPPRKPIALTVGQVLSTLEGAYQISPDDPVRDTDSPLVRMLKETRAKIVSGEISPDDAAEFALANEPKK